MALIKGADCRESKVLLARLPFWIGERTKNPVEETKVEFVHEALLKKPPKVALLVLRQSVLRKSNERNEYGRDRE